MDIRGLFRSIRLRLLAPSLAVALVAVACVAEDSRVVEGTINSIDCADGRLNLVTEDGDRFVLTISTPDCQAKNLQTGQKVRVNTDQDRRTVQNITVVQKTEVKQTTVVGRVVNVQGDQVTVQKDNGERVEVRVRDDQTRVQGDLRQDVRVEIRIDQETNVAQTVIVQAPGATQQPMASPTPTPAEGRAPQAGVTPTMAPQATPTPMPEATPTPAPTPTAAPTPMPPEVPPAPPIY